MEQIFNILFSGSKPEQYAKGGGVGDISEAVAKQSLMKLKESGEISQLTVGVHGQVFMSIKGGQVKSYDNYKDAYAHYHKTKYAKGGGVGGKQKYYDVEYEINGERHSGLYYLFDSDSVEKMLPPIAKIISIKERKLTRSQKQYNKEVDAYKWFIINAEAKRAESGWEHKEDALEALKDYDGDKNYKVVAESSLKKYGIDNPKGKWKENTNK